MPGLDDDVFLGTRGRSSTVVCPNPGSSAISSTSKHIDNCTIAGARKRRKLHRMTSDSDDICDILDTQVKSEETVASREQEVNLGDNSESERLLMRTWLMRQVGKGDIPGLVWHSLDNTMIRIPWVHGSRQTWDKEKHSELFRRWAEYTGRFDERCPDAKKWKANFRCALNSLPDVKEVKALRKKGQHAYKVYKLHEPRRRGSIIIRNRVKYRRPSLGSTQEQNAAVPYSSRVQNTIYTNDGQPTVEETLSFHPSCPSSNLNAAMHETARSLLSLGGAHDVSQSPSSTSTTSEDEAGPKPEHAYAHTLAPRKIQYIPEPVIQLSVESATQESITEQKDSNKFHVLHGHNNKRLEHLSSNYCNSGSHSESENTSQPYTEQDFARVTEFLMNNKDRLPDKIENIEIRNQTPLQPLAVTEPVIMNHNGTSYATLQNANATTSATTPMSTLITPSITLDSFSSVTETQQAPMEYHHVEYVTSTTAENTVPSTTTHDFVSPQVSLSYSEHSTMDLMVL